MTLHERVDTKINLQNLLTAVALSGGLITWGMRMEARLSVVEQVQKVKDEIDKRQDVEKDRMQDLFRSDLKDINGKLDHLIEQHSGRP